MRQKEKSSASTTPLNSSTSTVIITNTERKLEVATTSFLKIIIPKKSRIAYLNNNPGNLIYAGQKNAVRGHSGFARFRTAMDGFRALQNQIRKDQSRNLTLRQFVNKYAPSIVPGNNNSIYINDIHTYCGLHGGSNINSVHTDCIAERLIWLESGSKIIK